MKYTKPELEIKKFDILEAIMADGASAIGGEIIPSKPAIGEGESEDGGINRLVL